MLFKTKKDEDNLELIETLYREHCMLLYSVAYHVLRDKHTSEDAVNETFTRVIKYRRSLVLDNSDTTRGLLCVICKNVAIDMYNERQNESLTDCPEKELTFSNNTYNPEQIIINREAVNDAMNLLDDIGEKYKAVVVLANVYNMNADTISKMLNLTPENVKKRLYRARKKVAQDRAKKDSLDRSIL